MDEQFSHDGGERDLGGFALGAKLLVVRLEERVVQGGPKGQKVFPADIRVPLASTRVHLGPEQSSHNPFSDTMMPRLPPLP